MKQVDVFTFFLILRRISLLLQLAASTLETSSYSGFAELSSSLYKLMDVTAGCSADGVESVPLSKKRNALRITLKMLRCKIARDLSTFVLSIFGI
jgi:hypothetical protein